MRIAILGGTGRIGGHVLNWALDAGYPVTALARRPEALRQAALAQGGRRQEERGQAARGHEAPGREARGPDALVGAARRPPPGLPALPRDPLHHAALPHPIPPPT